MADKILLATMGLDIGGAETHVVELALELKRRGCEVLVASNGGVYQRYIEDAGIRHYSVPMNRRSVGCMVRSYFLLRKIIKSEHPDIVHAHARIPGFICGLLRRRLHFPFVTSAHGVFDAGGSLRYLTNWGQKTIAVAPDIREYLIQNYGLNARDIYTTINGIDTGKFSPDADGGRIISEFGLDQGSPVIGHVSRLDEQTALVARQLIELTPRLDEALPGIQLLITGDGGAAAKLSERAGQINALLGRRAVVMTGARTDVGNILAACDLFVGVSRAALEALSSGKPTVIAGAQGYLGLLTPDRLEAARETNFCGRGQILPTEKLLSEEITRCLAGLPDGERARLGRFGRELILSDYSVSRMTSDCIDAYNAVRQKRRRIVLSGYYGFGNAGDEAILQSISENIMSISSDIAITVLSSNPEDTRARYGCEAVNRFKLLKVIGALRRCDALVSGGGSLMQDHTSTRSLLYYLMIIRLAKLLGKKVMIYANGIGPVTRRANRRRVRRTVGRADVVSLRDEQSLAELRGMGVTREDILVTADPVFTLGGLERGAAAALLRELGAKPEEPFAVISVRDWDGAGDFTQKVARLADEIYERLGLRPVFIAMQTPNDAGITRRAAGFARCPVHVVDRRLSAEELMGIIGMAEFVLAMRLHTLIFAARVATPLAGIVYDPKVEAYLHTLSMPSAGTVERFDVSEAFAAARYLTEHREACAASLRGLSEQLAVKARGDARLLLDLLEAAP